MAVWVCGNSDSHAGHLKVIVNIEREEAMLLVVFFSSRRRHTRLQGDWSSDVCSSDLMTSCRPVFRDGPGDRQSGPERPGAPRRRTWPGAVGRFWSECPARGWVRPRPPRLDRKSVV